MLEGWRNQQLARNLALATIAARERAARAFTAHADAFPWLWTAAMLDEWLGDLRAVRGLRRSTLRGYQEAIRMLCLYLTDPAYGWAGECETRFGTHPVQVVHEWNTAVHVQQAEGDPVKRAFTLDELQVVLRPRRRRGRPHPRRRAQGLAAGVPRRHPVQDRLRVRVAAQRNPDARCRRLRHQPARARVRRARGLLRPPRQGHEGLRPETAQRADRLALGQRGPRRVDHPDPAAARRQSAPASAALWPSERAPRVGLAQIDARFAAFRTHARVWARAGLPLTAPLLRHAPDRGRVGPAVRAAPGRARARLHHRDLHLRVLGLPHPHPAPRPGRHPHPGHHRTTLGRGRGNGGRQRDRRGDVGPRPDGSSR